MLNTDAYAAIGTLAYRVCVLTTARSRSLGILVKSIMIKLA